MKNDPGPESVYTIYSCAANPNAQTHPVSLPSWLLACFFIYRQTVSGCLSRTLSRGLKLSIGICRFYIVLSTWYSAYRQQ